jgi:hypothetical protein
LALCDYIILIRRSADEGRIRITKARSELPKVSKDTETKAVWRRMGERWLLCAKLAEEEEQSATRLRTQEFAGKRHETLDHSGAIRRFATYERTKTHHGVNWRHVMIVVLYVLLGIMGLAILTDVAGLMSAKRLRVRGSQPARPDSGVHGQAVEPV